MSKQDVEYLRQKPEASDVVCPDEKAVLEDQFKPSYLSESRSREWTVNGSKTEAKMLYYDIPKEVVVLEYPQGQEFITCFENISKQDVQWIKDLEAKFKNNTYRKWNLTGYGELEAILDNYDISEDRIVLKQKGCGKKIFKYSQISSEDQDFLREKERISSKTKRILPQKANRKVPQELAPTYTSPAPTSSGSGKVYVKGYYRKDGTYVRPHTRRKP